MHTEDRQEGQRVCPSERGYTLIELLLVVIIIGILASMATLGWDVVRRERVNSTTREILADLQQTRMNALTQGPSPALPGLRGFGFRLASPTSIVKFTFDDTDGDYAYGGVGEEANAITQPYPPTITIQIMNTPAASVIIFERMGTPTRYQPDGTPYTPAAGQPVLVLRISDSAVSNLKCINVMLNSMREGTWNATTTTCDEL